MGKSMRLGVDVGRKWKLEGERGVGGEGGRAELMRDLGKKEWESWVEV